MKNPGVSYNEMATMDGRRSTSRQITSPAMQQMRYGGFLRKPWNHFQQHKPASSKGSSAAADTPFLPASSLAQVTDASLSAFLHDKNMKQGDRLASEPDEIQKILREQRSGPRLHTAMKIRIVCGVLGIVGLLGLMALGSKRFKEHKIHEDWIALEKEQAKLRRLRQEEDDRSFHESIWKFTADALKIPEEESKKAQEEEPVEDDPVHEKLFRGLEDFAKDAFKLDLPKDTKDASKEQ